MRVQFADDEAQVYLVPLACVAGKAAQKLVENSPHAVIARLQTGDGDDQGVIYDAMWDESFATALLDAVLKGRKFRGISGVVTATARAKLQVRGKSKRSAPSVTTLHATHNNTAIIYGEQFILKLIRCLDDGVNPELEIGTFLTEHGFAQSPMLLGSMSYQQSQHAPATLAILQPFIPNRGELWETMQAQLADYFARAAGSTLGEDDGPVTAAALLELADQPPSDAVRQQVGPFLERAQLLGQRTAELHLALASGAEEAEFAPQPFTSLYQRALYQSLRSLISQVFDDLRKREQTLSKDMQRQIRAVLDGEQQILERCKAVTAHKIDAMRIRCHGDYHLGQVLDTGDDFVIFDFEGESRRPVLERQLKRAAFEDVAAMLRSIYAVTAAYAERDAERGWPQGKALEQSTRAWIRWVSAAFIRGYLQTADIAPFVPQARADQILLLDALLIEKTIDALDRQLREEPERLPGALKQLCAVLGSEAERSVGK